MTNNIKCPRCGGEGYELKTEHMLRKWCVLRKKYLVFTALPPHDPGRQG